MLDGLLCMHKDLISAGFFIKKVDVADINKKDKTTFYIVSKELLNHVSETVVLKYDKLFKFSKFFESTQSYLTIMLGVTTT